ncbi:hypothetical protein TEA_009339 [Camellia sinensis var. sinensis]|uniref:glycerophosphodiester phosphodiesterase n=1 Tax=Camellia sinensis var. sinensis TaxID=542762 RepID=A0A4S4CXX5_CAMSN|nr:hypothetical protein TEA_009339 [Camellia sinensis var. sinensis]
MTFLQKAIEEGADFIESDILASKDGFLICMHDVTLDATTDIAEHKEFGRGPTTSKGSTQLVFSLRFPFRDQQYNGKFPFEIYDEPKSLLNSPHVKEVTLFHGNTHKGQGRRLPTMSKKEAAEVKHGGCPKALPPTPSPINGGKFQIITFEEYISIALDAPRVVGIYPEIKNPVLMNQHVKWPGGKRYEDIFVETLQKYGYKGSYMSKDWLRQPAFVQSFAPTSLIYISNQTDLPKLFLIDDVTIPTQDTNQSFSEITSDAYFNFIKDYVVGIGPWKDNLVPVVNNYLQKPTDIVAKAHACNLQVHPYTFRSENMFLHLNFKQDPFVEYDYWINKIGVDGLFTDFTGSLHEYQEWNTPLSVNHEDKSSTLLHKIASLISKYQKN